MRRDICACEMMCRSAATRRGHVESVSTRHPRKSGSLKRQRKWILPTLCFPRAQNELGTSHLCPNGKQQIVTIQCVPSVLMAGRRASDAAEHQCSAEVMIADDSPVQAPPVATTGITDAQLQHRQGMLPEAGTDANLVSLLQLARDRV